MVKSKSGAEMSHGHAQMALMPRNILMNLCKFYNTRNRETKKRQNEVFSWSPGPGCPPRIWQTSTIKQKKKKSNSFLGPHIVLHFPLMHGHCHVAGRREGERDRNRGRERQQHRMRSWGGGWPPSLVSRAFPRGKDVLNQAFVRRHNRGPTRAQGCSVW